MTSISDLSDSMSAGQALSTPLLGSLPQHERDESDTDYYDEEEGCMPCSRVSGDNDNDNTQPSRWNDNCVAWVVLSALLSLQFGMVLYMAGAKATTTTTTTTTTGPRWTLMIYDIVLFVAIAMFYHRTVKAFKMTWTVVLVAPEILLNIILGLAMLDQLDAALVFMLCSILCLAVLTTVVSIRGVVHASSRSVEEDDCKQVHDELDVTFFKGGRIRTTQMM
jgi:hypothetical protein